MKISEIYDKYQQTYSLRVHMPRVAAIATLICRSFNKPIKERDVVTACLLHDIGNIVKFDLDYFDTKYFEPEGLDYWKQIQREYKERYGTNEHEVTEKILCELGAKERIKKIIQATGFKQAMVNAKSDDFERKICCYADMRAAPLDMGVTGLSERLQDLKKRYAKSAEVMKAEDSYETLAENMILIEQQIFEHSKIKPADINNQAVKPLSDNLLTYEI